MQGPGNERDQGKNAGAESGQEGAEVERTRRPQRLRLFRRMSSYRGSLSTSDAMYR